MNNGLNILFDTFFCRFAILCCIGVYTIRAPCLSHTQCIERILLVNPTGFPNLYPTRLGMIQQFVKKVKKNNCQIQKKTYLKSVCCTLCTSKLRIDELVESRLNELLSQRNEHNL